MKKTSLAALVALAVMLISVFAPVAFSTGPTQPPVVTNTWYQGNIAWGPRRADPVRAYDTGSGELLFNVYDTLIGMGSPVGSWVGVEEQYWAFEPSLSLNVPEREEVIMIVPDLGINPTDPVCYWFEPLAVIPPEFAVNPFYHINGWIDNNPDGILGPCDVLFIGEFLVNHEPQSEVTKRTWHVLDYLPGDHLTLHHWYYDFLINPDPAIVYRDNTLAVVDTFDVYDAEYSFERGLVQDQLGSPMWMYYKPLFDTMNSDPWVASPPVGPKCYELAYLIKDAIEVVSTDPEILRINVGIAFPDVAFKQVIAQTWAAIVSKEWCIGRGCWNGDLFQDTTPADGIPDWVTTNRRKLSPINSISAANYCGTGPYIVVTTTSGDPGLVIMQRNAAYWKGWPAPGRPAFLEYIDIEYISDWTARKLAFVACQLDVCAVPRAFMLELLDPTDTARMTPLYPEMITIKNIAPVLSIDAIHYCFNINPIAPGIWTGTFTEGIPTNFFNNSHVRKAFSYAFDRAKHLHEVWLDEAICRETPDILGLVPDYYCLSPDPPWTYTKNLDKIKEELEQAMFTQDSTTQSVWAWGGFKITIYYNSGNDVRRLACENIKQSFDELNTQYGKDFEIVIDGPDWPTILDMMENFELPLFQMGWLADFADADNWKRPYMHSYGDFSYFQDYSEWNGWAETVGPRTGMTKDILIDLAVKTPDGPEREEMYKDLDDIYILDCPSLPTAQGLGRRWAKYWTKGWYFNGLYPSQYYYKLYKANACWADVTSATPGIPEGTTNMRDIGYIAAQFGAKAPDPARIPPYDPRWAPGTYGCGGYDVYGDRIINMRDIGLACAHFGDTTEP